MPASWRGKPFRPEQFSRKVINRMLQLIQFVERFTKPRLVSFARSRGIRIALGILTGAPLPDGADAVVMAEVCKESGERVEVHDSVAPHKNVGAVGEDIAAGTQVLGSGRRLRAQDVGLLASIGVAEPVCVRRQS